MTRQLILGIETSTPSGGIALAEAGRGLLSHHWSISRTGYSRRLMPMIDSALTELDAEKSDLTAIGVTVGPGSFTGVRIGVVAAKTIASSLGIPLYTFSTLRTTSARCPVPGAVVAVLLDARRSEVYSGVFRIRSDDEPEILQPDSVGPAQEVFEQLSAMDAEAIWMSGDWPKGHVQEIQEALGEKARFVAEPWSHPAGDMVCLHAKRAWERSVQGRDPKTVLPTYIRASDAERNLTKSAP